MNARSGPSLRQRLKSQIEAELGGVGPDGKPVNLSETDLREALAERNRTNYSPFETVDGLDLFGDPVVSCSNQMGRPPHLPTEETRQRVAELRQCGSTHPEIASALGISAPTLRLNYPIELGSSSQTWRRRSKSLNG